MDHLAPILVLGLGNDILTDDAVGLHVVAGVHHLLEGRGETLVEAKGTTEMGLALLDEIVDRECVVLVDSVQTGKAPPGHIHDLDVDELPGLFTTSPHFLGVRESIALGSLLGLKMPDRIRIVAIEVDDPYTLGTEMTPAVASAVAQATERALSHALGTSAFGKSAPTG